MADNYLPVSPVEITKDVIVGRGSPLLLIAGPCQIESKEHALQMAEELLVVTKGLPIAPVYKSSFDKANRTKLGSARGVGIDAGLQILSDVRSKTGLPVLTDVHSVDQATAAGAVVDVLQIPAFLCRQTDLLLAAGATGKAINVKKGQFLHPHDMGFAAQKISSQNNSKILLCERGTCFGYRDLIVDMRSFPIMRSLGYPVIFDATHSVQQMGGDGSGSSGGLRHFIAPLLRGALAVCVDGVFIEFHQDPDNAPSDGPSMVPLSELRALLESACKIWEATR